MSYSDCNLSPEGEELSLDDCDALLKFPYQDYVVQDKRKEVNFSDLPELGISANLSLDDDNSQSTLSVTSSASSENELSCEIEKIEVCLTAHNAATKKIVQLMNKLEEASTRNKDKLKQINEYLSKEEKFKSLIDKNRVSKPIQLFAAPYFRDIKGRDPPDNEDTITKAKNYDITAYHHPPKPWTLAEKDQLVEGVGANALSYILKPYKAKRDFLKSKMKDKDATDEEIVYLKKDVIAIERKMKEQSERLYKDLVEEAKDHIDWMVISATNLEGNRTEEECELLWNNYLCPFVNKEPFTRAEDEQLRSLAEKYNRRHWSAVTEELNTDRSVIQVFERYQTKLNKELCKKYWTPEEDEMLLNLVGKYKMGNFINWNAICCKMEGRSRYQIINRYERTLCANIRRDPWCPEEDAMLYACVYKFGFKWTKMLEFFTGRPIYSIRERYVNTLDPKLKFGDWSKAEDMELIKLIKRHGYGRWSYISKFLPGRTDNMCYNRTKRLIIHSLAKSGEYDIDWDTIDPKKLVEKLKPVANSKACISQNAKLRDKQESAQMALNSALEKIAPLVDETINLEKVDWPTLSLNTLRLLCKELGSSDVSSEIPKYQPKYLPFLGEVTNRPTFRSKKKRLKKENGEITDEEVLSDEDSDLEENIFADEINISLAERIWLRKVMDHKFEEEASLVFYSQTSKQAVCLNTKETLETDLYKNYLQKKLWCKNYYDLDKDEFMLGGVEVNNSMNQITHLFIQPNTKEDSMPVLPPNISTIQGLELIFLSEKRLRRTGEFCAHSMDYVNYASGFNSKQPMCLACAVKSQAPPVGQTYEQVVKDMKSNMLLIDEVMHKEALIESRAGAEKYPECQCAALENSKFDVELLIRRFLAMFLWPYFLHTTGVKEEQEKFIYQSKGTPLLLEKKPVKQPKEPSRGRKPKSHFACRKRTNKSYGIKRTYSKKATIIKKELSSGSEFETTSSTPSSELRRSARKCVRNRKSFIKAESEDEEEMT